MNLPVLICILIVIGSKTCYGVGSFSVSPDLSQTNWVTNYVGTMYTVTYFPTSPSLSYVWAVTPLSSTPNFIPFEESNCTNGVVSAMGFSASCSTPGQVVFSAVQPFTSAFTMSFAAAGPSNLYSFFFTITMFPIAGGCSVAARPFSTLLIASSSSCDFGCTVTYQCLPGYVSEVGSTYNAVCSAQGTLEPSELCILIGSGSNNIPVKSLIFWSQAIFLLTMNILLPI